VPNDRNVVLFNTAPGHINTRTSVTLPFFKPVGHATLSPAEHIRPHYALVILLVPTRGRSGYLGPLQATVRTVSALLTLSRLVWTIVTVQCLMPVVACGIPHVLIERTGYVDWSCARRTLQDLRITSVVLAVTAHE